MGNVYVQWKDDAGALTFVSFDALMSESPEFVLEISEHPVETGADVTDHAREKLCRLSVEGYVSDTPLVGGGAVGNQYLLLQRFSGEELVDFSSFDLKPYILPKQGGPFLLTPGGLTQGAVAAVGAATNALGITSPPGTSVTVLRYTDFQSRVQRIYDLLRDAQSNKRLVEVFGGIRDYENLLIERIGTPRTPEDGAGATFELDFRQVRFATTETRAAPQPSELRGMTAVSKGSKNSQPSKKPDDQKEQAKSVAASGFDGGFLD